MPSASASNRTKKARTLDWNDLGMTTEDTSPTSAATLDPPGTIAIIGAGPMGMEAALYGRYLGYKVTVFESDSVGCTLSGQEDAPVPMMPDRCLSPLALSALNAQSADEGLSVLPTTVGQWLDKVWRPLAETDLLRGRIITPSTVTKVGFAEPEPDSSQEELAEEELAEDELAEDEVPPDFEITASSLDSPEPFEAIIVATGQSDEIETTFQRAPQALPDYWFQIGRNITGNAEVDFLTGLKEIVAVYASLGGREDLDLYRPARG